LLIFFVVPGDLFFLSRAIWASFTALSLVLTIENGNRFHTASFFDLGKINVLP